MTDIETEDSGTLYITPSYPMISLRRYNGTGKLPERGDKTDNRSAEDRMWVIDSTWFPGLVATFLSYED